MDAFELISKYYKGPTKNNSKGIQILCPFHQDSDPSCIVFPNGWFKCWVCHPPGRKAYSPQEGFRALGVPEAEINFLMNSNRVKLDTIPAPLSSLGTVPSLEAPKSTTVEVLKQEPWPDYWKFRDVSSSIIKHPVVEGLVSPRLSRIRVGRFEEPFPRLQFSFGRHRLFLRLSSKSTTKVFNHFDASQNSHPFGLPGYDLSQRTQTLICVEGPYDWLRVQSHLLDLDVYPEVVCLALLGVQNWQGIKWKIENLIFPKQKIALRLMFDNDEAGQVLTKEVLNSNSSRPWCPDLKALSFDAKDPGDLNVQGFKKALGV